VVNHCVEWLDMRRKKSPRRKEGPKCADETNKRVSLNISHSLDTVSTRLDRSNLNVNTNHKKEYIETLYSFSFQPSSILPFAKSFNKGSHLNYYFIR
jgi:hypothetical protein